MGQSIQEWTVKQNSWKTIFKKSEVVWSALTDHITLNFFKSCLSVKFRYFF